jgi:2-polyprenyl-3-methyl-5-hydroxy-6-metoxy-1,4-benzoquinol methylase
MFKHFSIENKDIIEFTGLKDFALFSHQRRKRHIITLISNHFPIGSSILDFGCASGDISLELAILGFDVHGIDLEPTRLIKAKQLSNKYSQNILFENRSYHDLIDQRKYDIIFMGEILEHFDNPINLLRDIIFLLNPNGCIVITVPNMPSLRNRLKFGLFGLFPDNNPEHHYYFDVRRFHHITAEADYEILYQRTRFTNILQKSKFISFFDSALLFWFSLFFSKSGDTLFAIIRPNPSPILQEPSTCPNRL